MKKLLAVAVAGGALLAFQGATASPASAFGWCGASCCAPVFRYRPVCGCRVASYRAVKRVRARAKPMK